MIVYLKIHDEGTNDMKYQTAWCTDVGIRKDTNQDSALLMQAESVQGSVLFAVICDGMGGLAKGEVASASLIQRFRNWFVREFPLLLQESAFSAALSQSWNRLIQEQNRAIADYGQQFHVNLGTTVAALLLVGDNYYIINVGDSRVYLLSSQIYQLTHDQTVVQKEIDEGRLTPEQAASDPRSSVLLQCVGASQVVAPEFLAGEVEHSTRFLLCCDGFRHEISPQEMYETLSRSTAVTKQDMEQGLQYLVELNKNRNEVDNITALMIDVE